MGYRQVPGITAAYAGPYIPLAQALGKCQWLRPDIEVMVDSLCPYVPGDGLKFKNPAINAATQALNAHIIRGGPKKTSSVRDKVAELTGRFHVVDELMNLSGVDYSEELGCNIHGPEAERVWAELVRAKPARAPFKNVGWDLYDTIARLRPGKAKGSHTYRPKSGTQGQPDLSASLAVSSQADGATDSSDSDSAHDSPPRDGSPTWDIEEDTPEASLELEGVPAEDASHAPPSAPTRTPSRTPARTPAPAPAAAANNAARTPASLKRRSSSSATSAPSKRARSGPVEAAEIMRESVRDFGQLIVDSSNVLADAVRPQVDASPVRRKRAFAVLNAKDSEWLDMDNTLLLGEQFADSIKADTYLEWDSQGTPKRRAWVARALKLPNV